MTQTDAPLRKPLPQFVQDGDCLYAAGFTHLIPFAAGHEIIRQRRRDLVLARATPDLIYDQMVAAGCARKVIFSYMGNPGVGSLRIVRAEIEAGRLEWEEYSHFSMITRLQAGAAGLPFMPMNPTAAGDLERANPSYRRVIDPYSGQEVVVVPALQPDVAIVHVQRADAEGNAQIWGIIGEQKEAAFAARAGDPDRRGDRGRSRDPLRPQPHPHPRLHRQMPSAMCLTAPTPPTPRAITTAITPSTWPGTRSARRPRPFRPTWTNGCTASRTGRSTGKNWALRCTTRLRVPPKYAAPVNYGQY